MSETTDITALTNLVTTTLANHGEKLQEVRESLSTTVKELQALRLDVVRLQEQGYERRLEALAKKVESVCSSVRDLNREVDDLKLNDARVEGMSTAAKMGWGLIASAPGIAALILKALAG